MSKLTGLRASLACAVSAASLAAFAAAAAPVAITQYGRVTGTVAEGMKEFLGIRYAAPPMGALRWQPPQPVPENLATHTATAFGPHCAQPASAYGVASNTEDCLYLNVFAPDKPQAANAPKLPVMVWIHGGALVVGESDAYDPARLVNDGNIIFVSINYRLGYLGYLATAGLDAEGHLAANYGLQDQQFALDWVQRNIAGFGGDPKRVTVSGESAGGLSTLSNLVSPTAYGLFSRAIVESGAYALTLPTLAQAEASGAAIASGAGCQPTDTTCLRALTVPQVLTAEASAGLSVTTIVDGTTLPLSINTALKSGRFNRVPVLNGSNHDEYRQFLSAEAGLTAAQYPYAVASVYGAALAPAIVARYPVADYAKTRAGAGCRDYRPDICLHRAAGRPLDGQLCADLRLRVQRPACSRGFPAARRLQFRRVACERAAIPVRGHTPGRRADADPAGGGVIRCHGPILDQFRARGLAGRPRRVVLAELFQGRRCVPIAGAAQARAGDRFCGRSPLRLLAPVDRPVLARLRPSSSRFIQAAAKPMTDRRRDPGRGPRRPRGRAVTGTGSG